MSRLPSYQEGTATEHTGANPIPFYATEKIIYVSNDDPNFSLRYNFNAPAGPNTGYLLKSGEAKSDIPIPAGTVITQLYVYGVGGPVAFRAEGV